MTIRAAQRCKARNKRGEPCGSRAIERGLCAAHSGRVDMVAIGRAGGSKVPESNLRRELKQDDAIRAQAKDVIRRGLEGDDSITKTMLDAARSVFSFRAASPPGETLAEPTPILTSKGQPVTGIFDVLEMALDRAPEIFVRDPRWHEFLDRMNALRAEPAALAASTPISNGTTKETA